jgi:hypothetical protein
MRATVTMLVAATVAVAVSACGSSTAKQKVADGPLHVNMVALRADTGFPAPASRRVTLWRGYPRFAAIARLVPLPLPTPLARPKTGMTICVPVMLTIRLSNRHNYVYRGCQRPPSLRPVLNAMCPLLRQPDFCARYRAELTVARS